MKRFLILLGLCLILLGGGILGLKFLQPTTFNALMIAFELSPNAKEEKARLDRIKLLAISEEKKRILASKTIFLGASLNMTELALGNPIKVYSYPDNSPRVDRWVYYFADESRPTILEFHDNKLASAYKVSAHKLDLPTSEETTRQELTPATASVPAPDAP